SWPAQPGWDSPGGRGRPGGPIECSAMIRDVLGETIDIHGGGLDLIFPHHENEIAQSRCAHGTDVMANVWMHNGFLQVEGKKMSKSDGNFVTIQELLDTERFGGRKWPGEVLRLAMLMTHYKEPIDFSVRRLEEAEEALTGWARAASNVAPTEPSAAFIAAWMDDLGGAAAIAELHRLRRQSPEALRASLDLIAIDISSRRFHGADLEYSGPTIETTTRPDVIKKRIEARLELLGKKNFAEADRIRDELLAQGIQLKDGKDPVTGERVTTWEVKR
ncbi:MAG: cysteine--tRNA ligase, partial [Rhizobiaceae bacterium]|nr:cysteine--tRNA ligase [Rhizobiaceae bacterium]